MLRRLRGAVADIAFIGVAAWWPSAIGSWWQQRHSRGVYHRLADLYDVEVASDLHYGLPLQAAITRVHATPSWILDVSTGTGYAALALTERFPHARIAACDLSAHMLRQAVGNAARAGRQLLLTRANSRALPYRAGTFDLVVLQNALPLFQEMVRVLKVEGALLACFSTGARVPRLFLTALKRRLRRYGIAEVEIVRVGPGLFIYGRKMAPLPPPGMAVSPLPADSSGSKRSAQ